MRDWAIEYILHVLEKKDWSANRLATEAKVAASTINRPLREKDYAGNLSRNTISKIYAASGIDPAPFIPKEMAEDSAIFAALPRRGDAAANAARIEAGLNDPPAPARRNEIKVAIVDGVAQIVATIDKEGLARLRQKLDAIEMMIDD